MIVPGIAFVQGRNDYPDGDGRKYGIAIHNTSNDASDEAEAAYATRRTDGVSSHFYVDDDSVTQSLDTESRAGHAGSRIGNENALCFELTGANGKTRDWWLANIAWTELGRVIAYILTHDPDLAGFQVRRASVAEMQSNPRVKAFYGHDDMRRAWGGTTHTDPGPNFPWDRLFAAVNAALGSGGGAVYGTVVRGAKGDAAAFVQGACKDIDPAALPRYGIDADYGAETVEWVKRLFGGGDGSVFGPAQYRAYGRKLAAKYAGRDGKDGAPGEPGPSGPSGPAGAAAVLAPGATLRVE